MAHFVDVLARGEVIGIFAVVGYAPAKNDSAQVEPLAKFFPRLVQPTADAQAAVVGVNEYIYAIKHIAFKAMGVEAVVAGYFVVGVVIAKLFVVDDKCQRTTDHFPIDHHG